jgi:hypothetical protein
MFEASRWPVAVSLFVLAAAIGCNRGNQAGSKTEEQFAGQIAPHDRPYVTDVPLPAGFKIIENESEDRMTGKRRVYVRHMYAGREDPYLVRDFYIEHMPKSGWKVVHADSSAGRHQMRFQKRRESCTITISRPGAWKKVRIEIMILQDQ